MALFWRILRKFPRDFLEESFLLILLNIVWIVASLPGLLVGGYGAFVRSLSFIALGVILMAPLPFVTLGAFSVVHRVGEGKTIGLRSFLREGKRLAGIAYLWGGVNLLVVAILFANIRFYNSALTPWGDTLLGAVLSSLFFTLLVTWSLLQLVVLALLPRAPAPGLWDSFRRGFYVLLSEPVTILLVSVVIGVLGMLAVIVPPFGFLFGFISVVVLMNRAMTEITATEPFQRLTRGAERGG